MPATSACEPSPPAMPTTSAPGRSRRGRAARGRRPAGGSRSRCHAPGPPPRTRRSPSRRRTSGFMMRTGCRAAPTGVPRDGSSAIVDGSLRSALARQPPKAATSTTASTMSPKLWLRSRVAKATDDRRQRDDRGREAHDPSLGHDVPRRRQRHGARARLRRGAVPSCSRARRSTTASAPSAHSRAPSAHSSPSRPVHTWKCVTPRRRSARPCWVIPTACGTGRCRGRPRAAARRGGRSR